MLEGQQFDGFAARVMEVTSTSAPWHRLLWRGGTMQIARELLDESVRPGMREAAISDQRKYLTAALATDHGIPDRGVCVRDAVRAMKPGITELSHDWIALREHITNLDQAYLTEWAAAFDLAPANKHPLDTEGAARRIVSHLLDAGMHRSSLYAWVRSVQRDAATVSIGDFLREAHQRIASPQRTYTFCVPVANRPAFRIDEANAPGWMNAADTAAWKNEHAPSAASTRHYGSFLLEMTARDVNAAAEKARGTIADLAVKFEIGVTHAIRISPTMWSLEKHSEFPTHATNRIINVRAFERLGLTQQLTMPSYIANTLALLQPLRTGAPHIAVMSGWSAIESLLVGPADEQDVAAAARFSLIVAASMIRAELTRLSRRYIEVHADRAAEQMRACPTNIERARLFQMHAVATPHIDLQRSADNLALARIRPVLTHPKAQLERISEILTREFTRLYRKRNMIVHGGQIHESNLQAISDTLAPLIGAGVDRIVHHGLKSNISPIELSAVAQTRLQYLTPTTATDPGNILDVLEFD